MGRVIHGGDRHARMRMLLDHGELKRPSDPRTGSREREGGRERVRREREKREWEGEREVSGMVGSTVVTLRTAAHDSL